MSCSICGNELSEKSIIVTQGNVTKSFCCHNCMYQADQFSWIKHRSISSIVLNKTFFEIFAIITGVGGVYYTIFGNESRALLMDTLSVATALTAIFIGIEHLQYVEEHDLLKRTIIFLSILIVSGFVLIVWIYGFKI